MVDGIPQPLVVGRCRARPRAARPGYRDDMFCASSASAWVRHREHDVAVCRIHEAMYGRWADDAAENASDLWAWPDDASLLMDMPDTTAFSGL
jgi:hypothetical protein